MSNKLDCACGPVVTKYSTDFPASRATKCKFWRMCCNWEPPILTAKYLQNPVMQDKYTTMWSDESYFCLKNVNHRILSSKLLWTLQGPLYYCLSSHLWSKHFQEPSLRLADHQLRSLAHLVLDSVIYFQTISYFQDCIALTKSGKVV